MAASFLKKWADRNATAPETRTNAKNQAESETDKVLFFNRPVGLMTCWDVIFRLVRRYV
jgi:hypothetical protein